ncbi:MAG: class I SAM-dependent methyltransferase, partial [Gemmatimonadetes bacterium]|nr:class I SAM-dependent methyltransferase [Gemmatimonadota bacterium]
MADRRSILEGTTKKSSVDEIRRRFDREVDRFSNLETGQAAAMDAAVALSLVACAAAATSADARNLLDIGCGAGNFTLAVLAKLTSCDVTLLDLSRPMLDRAVER